ncbi:Rrf2 family transcriptional regulator [Pseudoduganella ginsengisoli]|uniref:Rrf2 family transcriptional regulator n=1 Tax=Pseudoduganella ginsengisoli TaxID=1462440 RepID=A0A6L6Q432_9BURK|nr:Rrf2 family transcriptional regulator [Pseudoduganella ginsengisoli]MTW04219.1 Rrf2 family transcriptional regulator [Pseudoduganella ginsengisoli]
MSHISTGVEYALHCLVFLSNRSGEEASAKDLAELQGIPADYVAKLFTKLSKAGLVRATEGVRGGFALARAPAAISVLEVVDAIDGGKPLFECREVRQRCAVFEGNEPDWTGVPPCTIHAVMLSAEQRMREELGSHTLADLVQRVIAVTPPSYNQAVVRWLDGRAASKHKAQNKRPDNA